MCSTFYHRLGFILWLFLTFSTVKLYFLLCSPLFYVPLYFLLVDVSIVFEFPELKYSWFCFWWLYISYLWWVLQTNSSSPLQHDNKSVIIILTDVKRENFGLIQFQTVRKRFVFLFIWFFSQWRLFNVGHQNKDVLKSNLKCVKVTVLTNQFEQIDQI